jgi:hypothetical protein
MFTKGAAFLAEAPGALLGGTGEIERLTKGAAFLAEAPGALLGGTGEIERPRGGIDLRGIDLFRAGIVCDFLPERLDLFRIGVGFLFCLFSPSIFPFIDLFGTGADLFFSTVPDIRRGIPLSD